MMLFLDMLVMLSVSVWALRLAMKGLITAQTAGIVLAGCALFFGFARSLGRNPKKLAMRIAVPVASAYAFLKTQTTDPRELIATGGMLLALIIAMAGLYIMVGGTRKRRRS